MSLSECKIGPAAAVSDIERAADFYENTLGLEIEMQGDEMRMYKCGEGTILAVYLAPDNAGTNKATLAGFAAHDFEALHTELSEKGVTFETYSDENGVTTDDNGVFEGPGFKAAWFKDPDGNIYSING